MSRTWVSNDDHRWLMACDLKGCDFERGPFPAQPPLEMFRDQGWFIAKVQGDRCPAHVGTETAPAYDFDREVAG